MGKFSKLTSTTTVPLAAELNSTEPLIFLSNLATNLAPAGESATLGALSALAIRQVAKTVVIL